MCVHVPVYTANVHDSHLLDKKIDTQIIVLITLGVHAHERYCSQFVCVCVCLSDLSVTILAPAYDVCATNCIYHTGLRLTLKVATCTCKRCLNTVQRVCMGSKRFALQCFHCSQFVCVSVCYYSSACVRRQIELTSQVFA